MYQTLSSVCDEVGHFVDQKELDLPLDFPRDFELSHYGVFDNSRMFYLERWYN